MDGIVSAPPFSGSYASRDVTFLLRPAHVEHVDVAAKERLIQSGAKHYSEMLSPEAVPDARYLELYREALARNAGRLRADIELLARRIVETRGDDVVLLSLVRAGTPVGVLLQRRLRTLGIDSTHYSISIVRGRGIDRAALDHVRCRHGTRNAVFIDGWTGKGAITTELHRSLAGTGFAPELAVIADPAGCAGLAATVDDYVIPSGLLNGIVSGLVSRSVWNDELVGPGDFHACRHLVEHAAHDLSADFIDAVEAAVPRPDAGTPWTAATAREACDGLAALTAHVRADAGVGDVNRIKPGIAEATRALLRRVPEALYVGAADDPDVAPLLHLAGRAGVPVRALPGTHYRAVTLIRNLGADA